MAVANISNKIISCCDSIVAVLVCAYKVLFFVVTNIVVAITLIACADSEVEVTNTKLFWIAASISCIGVVSTWKPRRHE
jgi:hypothetical protein